MTSFDEIMTERVKEKIGYEVRRDYEELRTAFAKFTRKYSMNGTCGDFQKIREHTAKNLADGRSNVFQMFPELEEYLFVRESRRLVTKLLEQEAKE